MSDIEAYDIARRLGLSTAQAVALAKVLRRSPRWKRRLRSAWRLSMMYLRAGLAVAILLAYGGMLGYVVARIITGDVP